MDLTITYYTTLSMVQQRLPHPCLPLFEHNTKLSRQVGSGNEISSFTRSATSPSVQSCCSLIASASAAAPCFRLLQLIASASAAARRLRPLRLLLPDCVCFDCCFPIASALTAAPRLDPLVVQPMPNVLEHSSRSSRFSKLKYEGRPSLV